MPELPEVETIVRDIRPWLLGRTISGMIIRAKAEEHIMEISPTTFYEETIGQTVMAVLRKGKYILLPLSNANVVVIHLGMTGHLLLQEAPPIPPEERLLDEDLASKHTHLLLEFADFSDEEVPDVELLFHDVRLFGSIWLVEGATDIEKLNVPGLRELGPDALGISLQEFQQITHSRRTVKSLLLDQSSLAGVGNIYADEACFLAKVHPAAKSLSLSEEQKAKLWFAVKTVLKEGISYRGSSTSDYITTDGSKGFYQDHHRVYGRTGKKCTECGTPIERMKVAGRSSHFCPNCQPLAKGGN